MGEITFFIRPLSGFWRQLMVDFLRELWEFLRVRKRYWLAPIIIVLLLLGALIVFSSGSAIAPFIYTLF